MYEAERMEFHQVDLVGKEETFDEMEARREIEGNFFDWKAEQIAMRAKK